MLQKAQGDQQTQLIVTARFACMAEDESLFPVLEAAVIPHWFDKNIIAGLLETDMKPPRIGCLERLKRIPMVESFAQRNGWNVHEATRLAIRRHLAATEPRTV